MAVGYELLVCDLRSDQLMDRLPVQGVSAEDYIGKTGSLSGTIPVPDRAMARRVQDALVPGRTALWLVRGQTVLWSGIQWTDVQVSVDRGSATVQVQAAGAESYFRDHRQIVDTLTATAEDQLDIVRDLINYAQGKTGGHIGIEVPSSPVSGVLRDRTYLSYDLAYVGRRIDELAATQQGFEWRINYYRDSGGARHRVLQLGYPTITVGSTDTVLSMPGQILSYKLSRDASVQANAWISRGASVNSNLAAASYPLMSAPLTTPADYAAGWPRLDGSSDYSSVTSQSVLDQNASADLARQVRPVVIPQVTIRPGPEGLPPLGSSLRLRIRDVWNPAGLTARYRLVGWRLQPEERGRGETADLYLEVI
ncbi:hypothetical protein RMN57_13290 [Kitasatospora sp. CM 4170]|uniref:Minor tail protein n=1 Tax=Kitasatospora aburaviensis TaxID=67265 RepID=A0ABW1ERU6_9ACTN|nr:hypothetical protein [Kitasatospora sp. CM 4170]WNM45628.1 hypothetical protein RMN57_13290 [Kitasatospora sp. CM 4170]